MSCLICCACALYMFHRGRVGNVLSIPLYVLTCKVIDNKATLAWFIQTAFIKYRTDHMPKDTMLLICTVFRRFLVLIV